MLCFLSAKSPSSYYKRNPRFKAPWRYLVMSTLLCNMDETVDELAPAGLLALWSMKNARTPVWTTKTRVGISALDFSTREPHMLAVGLQDGSLQLYEVQANKVPATLSAGDLGYD